MILLPYAAPALGFNNFFKPLYACSTIILVVGFLLKRRFTVPPSIAIIFLLSIFSATVSTAIGIINGWLLTDLIADLLRFIAPIFSFVIFWNLINAGNVKRVFYFIINYSTVLFLLSLTIKVINYGFTQNLITYGHSQIYIMPILALYWLVYKKSYVNGSIFTISPFLVLSKTFIIANISVVVLLRGWLFSLFVVFIAFFVFLNYGNNLGGRWSELFNNLEGVDFKNLSGSSGARIGEAINAILTVNENVLSLIYGQGNGALWYQKYAVITSGLSPSNFRSDGGAHHIHLTLIAIIFRNGVFGISIYVLFIAYLLHEFHVRNDVFAKMGKFLILYYLLIFLFTYSIYGELTFGLSMAVLLKLSIYKNQKYAEFLVKD